MNKTVPYRKKNNKKKQGKITFSMAYLQGNGLENTFERASETILCVASN